MNALRISDRAPVILKIDNEQRNPFEADTALFLSSQRLTSDPRNHCVPVFDELEVPNEGSLCIIVTPLLRPCDDSVIRTVGEAAELLRQVIEGLEYIHRHGVAHL